jgi:hypothetical protein
MAPEWPADLARVGWERRMTTPTTLTTSGLHITAGAVRRLVAKIGPATESGCLPWTGARSRAGYGYLKIEGRAVGAHRIMFTAWGGEIPAGYTLDHLCRVHHCVRPTHLEPVTIAENSRRGREWRRQHRTVTA